MRARSRLNSQPQGATKVPTWRDWVRRPPPPSMHVLRCDAPTLSFFSLGLFEIARKTSKTPRIFLTLRTLKNPGKQAENTEIKAKRDNIIPN